MPTNQRLQSPSLPAVARTTLATLLLVALALSGCTQSAAESPAEAPQGSPESTGGRQARVPPQADDPPPAAPPALVEQVIELSGTILLRPAGRPVLHSGDPPLFYLDIPNGAASLAGHAEWSPQQVMGLEFHGPGGNPVVRSWPATPNTQVAPPIDLRVEEPKAGEWHVYFGPSTVGGGADWNMTLRLSVPEGTAATIRPET